MTESITPGSGDVGNGYTVAGISGAITATAQALDISRKSLWEKMKRYGISNNAT